MNKDETIHPVVPVPEKRRSQVNANSENNATLWPFVQAKTFKCGNKTSCNMVINITKSYV
jgi:hypothetical protein